MPDEQETRGQQAARLREAGNRLRAENQANTHMLWKQGVEFDLGGIMAMTIVDWLTQGDELKQVQFDYDYQKKIAGQIELAKVELRKHGQGLLVPEHLAKNGDGGPEVKLPNFAPEHPQPPIEPPDPRKENFHDYSNDPYPEWEDK